MNWKIKLNQKNYSINTDEPIDISIGLKSNGPNPNAFGIDEPKFIPFKAGDFIGSVPQGGPCNCENLIFNAHGNGTHTECMGHISNNRITINEQLKEFIFQSQLISLTPQKVNDDLIISADLIPSNINNSEALIIRTLPNSNDKLTKRYSGTNPAYFTNEAMKKIVSLGVKHLLIDLPSVDKENDEGKLSTHHIFWNYPKNPRNGCTITEIIYVPTEIADGSYILNLQIASFESDASPSKPILYKLKND
jgi:arylformamidase